LEGTLSSVTVTPLTPELAPDHRKRALFIVVGCTLIGAAAQALIKSGANNLAHPGFIGAILGMFTNPPLFLGYCLYGVFAGLLVYALRYGELSILYPVIALTYVWVSIISVVMFHESMNLMKVVGVIFIVTGVAVLGRGGAKA
jgi:multidrug transporter EmrE-like cation transporter